MSDPLGSVEALEAEIDKLANHQFETPEYELLFSTRFTLPRARILAIHLAQFVRNRRDCWGYVSGGAPLDVKRVIWEHEGEELVRDPRVDTDHYTLITREAEALGLTAEDIENAELIPACVAACYGWLHLVKSSSWIEGFTMQGALEKRNSDAVMRGGGFTNRIRRKMIDELGIPQNQLVFLNTHVEADVEHPKMFGSVLARHADTREARVRVLQAAKETFILDRAHRGAIAQAMANSE